MCNCRKAVHPARERLKTAFLASPRGRKAAVAIQKNRRYRGEDRGLDCFAAAGSQ